VLVAASAACLSFLVFRYLVPSSGSGARGLVAALGHRYPVPFWAALFLGLSALGRYWAYSTPRGVASEKGTRGRELAGVRSR
jgi:hypothetical protein